MVSEHNLGLACAQDIMLSRGGDSLQGEDTYRGKKKRLIMEEEVSLLLFQTIEGIITNLNEIERKNWRDFLKGFVDEASHIYDHVRCEHSATHVDP